MFQLTTALPLTTEKVLEYIKTGAVSRKWNELGRWLLTSDDTLKKINSAEEEPIVAVVNTWLHGHESGQDIDLFGNVSWRSLIYALDKIGAITEADNLKSFTEPPEGSVHCCIYTIILYD